MAGRFLLYADADIQGPVVDALRNAGWDIVRAVDLFPEGTSDPIHFSKAAELGRALVTNDRRIVTIAAQWLTEGRPFFRVITWPRSHYNRMRPGDFVSEFEKLAAQEDPFGDARIIHLKASR